MFSYITQLYNHNLFAKSTHNLDKFFKIYCAGGVDVNLEKRNVILVSSPLIFVICFGKFDKYQLLWGEEVFSLIINQMPLWQSCSFGNSRKDGNLPRFHQITIEIKIPSNDNGNENLPLPWFHPTPHQWSPRLFPSRWSKTVSSVTLIELSGYNDCQQFHTSSQAMSCLCHGICICLCLWRSKVSRIVLCTSGSSLNVFAFVSVIILF